MILRIRSRDGLERVTVPDPFSATVGTLHSLIDAQLGVSASVQSISLDPKLLLNSNNSSNTPLALLSDPSAPLSSFGLSQGSVLFLSYPQDSRRSGPAPPPASAFTPSTRRKMTIDDLIARQVRVAPQESPHCDAASFDRDAANAFQLYAADTLAFAVKRAGFLYGRVGDDHVVSVDFIYEPPQQGSEEAVVLFHDPDEEALVDLIATGLGMRRVGFIFTQAVGRKEGTAKYTMSGREVLQAAEIQTESGIPEWITAIVKLEVSDGGASDVHFEAFQMSDTCMRLFKEEWFVTEFGEDDDPRMSRMKKDVVVAGKDTKEVDNDFFLVPVKISDHQGPLSATFPIENRITTVTTRALKNHLDRAKNLPFVKRISDFHLLLLLAKYLDVKHDIPALAECIQRRSPVTEGYKILIESLAATS